MTDSVAVKVWVIGLCSFSIFYIFASYIINGVLGGYDHLIVSGYATTDTVNHLSTVLDLWRLSPAVFLVGLVLWTIERAKGTNIGAGLFYMYESVLLVCIIYSVILLVSYGTVTDMIIGTLLNNPLVIAVPVAYNPTNTVMVLVKIIYIICVMPAYIGSLLFAIHPIINQTDSLIYGASDEPNGEYVTNFEQI
jgi:hypothetical protein